MHGRGLVLVNCINLPRLCCINSQMSAKTLCRCRRTAPPQSFAGCRGKKIAGFKLEQLEAQACRSTQDQNSRSVYAQYRVHRFSFECRKWSYEARSEMCPNWQGLRVGYASEGGSLEAKSLLPGPWESDDPCRPPLITFRLLLPSPSRFFLLPPHPLGPGPWQQCSRTHAHAAPARLPKTARTVEKRWNCECVARLFSEPKMCSKFRPRAVMWRGEGWEL
jgi:hypothetical protein